MHEQTGADAWMHEITNGFVYMNWRRNLGVNKVRKNKCERTQTDRQKKIYERAFPVTNISPVPLSVKDRRGR